MRVLILGCGVVGCAVAQRLIASGDAVIGVRRTPWAPGDIPTGMRAISSDAATVMDTDIDAVLLSANPGVRRGTDNGLLHVATLIAERYAHARAVCTGTTSVYASAAGQAVAEDGAIDATPEAHALVAIENAFLRHPNALVLRATALVGPTRTHARERVESTAPGATLTVRGNPQRPFSWLHEDDLADLCVLALRGQFGHGILNAAAPGVCTVADYYRGYARNRAIEIIGDGSVAPSRAIDATSLHRLVPNFSWRAITC